MTTPASFKGHPFHPMLVPLPIGLWIFSLISDLIFKLGWGGPVWTEVAFYTMAGGTIGALLAALPGFVDFLSLTDPKTKSTALLHMILNLLAVVVFAVNLWLRMHRVPGAALPIWLSVLGIILISLSGWLGGELVYRHRVGVEELPG